MKPTAMFTGTIADRRERGQPIDYELAERNTRAVLREPSAEEEQASRLFDGFRPDAEDTFFAAWPLNEEECLYAGLGTKCDPFGVYCDLKHVCMQCALKLRSAEESIDPPCPLRIPGCRCSTGAGPSMPEYHCNIGSPVMGTYVQGAGSENSPEKEIGDEEYVEEETREEHFVEETEIDEPLEDSENERLFKGTGGEKPLDDENDGEEFVEEETRNLCSPQSLWPISKTGWKGLVPGREQGRPLPSQPQVDHNEYSDYLSEPLAIDLQRSVADVQHARGGRVQSSVDVSQLPNVYNLYSAFLLDSPKPRNQNPMTASQPKPAGGHSHFFPVSSGLTNGVESPRRNVMEEEWPQASHEQVAGQKRAPVGDDRSSQQPAKKKDSRGWEEHEKALVTALMREVISEGTHALTEERWRIISRRLSSRYSIDRTWTAVKNYWNRQGRSNTNIDERKVKKPDRMITGVQDPESRRKASKLKRKDADSDNGNDLVAVDDDDDSDSAPLFKRQRL